MKPGLASEHLGARRGNQAAGGSGAGAGVSVA